jgi:hypothetical protein
MISIDNISAELNSANENDKNETEQSWQKTSIYCLYFFSTIGSISCIPAILIKKKKTSLNSLPPQSNSAPIAVVIDTSDNQSAFVINKPNKAFLPPCSLDDQQKICFILETLADTNGLINPFTTGVKLRNYGKDIENIHPYKFLASSPKRALKKIFQECNTFIKNNVLEGIAKNAEKKNSNLFEYLDQFSKEVNVSKEILAPLIEKRQWEKVIMELCQE